MKSIACKVLLSAGCLAMSAAVRAQEAPVVVQEEGRSGYVAEAPAPQPQQVPVFREEGGSEYVAEAPAPRPEQVRVFREEGGPEYVAAAPTPMPAPPQQVQVRDMYYQQAGPYGDVAIRAGEEEAGGWVGIAVSKAPPAMAYQLRLRPGVGVVVDNVVPKSPAQKAGLQPYDLIEKLDDQLLVNPEQFTTLIRAHKPGETVTLSIIREGEKQTIEVKLAQVRDQPMFQPFAGAGRPVPALPQPTWRRPLTAPVPPRFFGPNGMQKLPPALPEQGDLRIEREEPGRIIILRDGDGRQVLIVRDRNGKVLVKQPMNAGGPKAKASPNDFDARDRLKLKLREQSDDPKEPAFRKFPPKQDAPDDDDNDTQKEE